MIGERGDEQGKHLPNPQKTKKANGKNSSVAILHFKFKTVSSPVFRDFRSALT